MLKIYWSVLGHDLCTSVIGRTHLLEFQASTSKSHISLENQSFILLSNFAADAERRSYQQWIH